MRNGVPYDVAFSLPDNERTAYAIIFAEIEGSEFDWNLMRFKEQK